MRRVKMAFRTISGLMTLADVLSTIGFWLYRGTMRRTVGMAIALLTIFLVGKKAQSFDLAFSTVVGGTGLILIISCIGGALLMFVSGSFARSALTLGEAKGSNLLEDMKKARAAIHCHRLWMRVFRYEQAIFTPRQIEQEQQTLIRLQTQLEMLSHPGMRETIDPARRIELEDIVAALGCTYPGWELMFEHAMQLPLTRSHLKHQFRYDLSKLKDWYDGAPFHRTDTKLRQQFDAGEHLQEAKHEARLTRFFMLTHTRKRLFQSLWFKVITRAIQIRVAGACRQLDKHYRPFHFSTDQFLWPNPHTDEMIRKRLGEEALDELIEYRQRIFQRVLNPEPELAFKLMHKAIYPNFDAATQLRRLYDPLYVLGELDESWSEDVVRYNRALTPEDRGAARRRLFVQQTRRRQEALNVYLKTHPEFGTADDPEALRALRVAVHIDREGINELMVGKVVHNRSWRQKLGDLLSGRAPTRPTTDLDSLIRLVIAGKQDYTRRLRGVRIYHELTRNELEDYEFYIHRIMQGRGREEELTDAERDELTDILPPDALPPDTLEPAAAATV